MPRFYWVDFYAFPIATIVIVVLTFRSVEWLVFFLSGLLLFSFAEYFVHCILLHHVFTDSHIQHHSNPREYVNIPWYTSFAIAVPLALVLPWGMLCGAMAAYGFYCYVHHTSHHRGLRYNNVIKSLCLNHNEHHIRNNVNFGVTSPLFDIIFRTYQKPVKALS